MIRINITKRTLNLDTIRHTVSMQSMDQFVNYLKDNYSFHSVKFLAKTVWNLKVAEPYTQDGYTFSIQSKRRSGNILMNGN
jgi:hypothetical protein